MAAKEILFSQPARQAIAQGLNILANTVKATLGNGLTCGLRE